MITRGEAIDVLNDLIDSDILKGDIEESLDCIMQCIKAEQELNIHAWGMPDKDFCTLHIAMRTDHPDYPKFVADCERIVEEWRFHDKTTGD